VCYIDPVHGCGVFLGDVSGVVSFYKVGAGVVSTASLSPPLSSASPDITLPPSQHKPLAGVSTPPLPSPVIVAQQALYSTKFHASARRELNTTYRLLDMKICGLGQCDAQPVASHKSSSKASMPPPPPPQATYSTQSGVEAVLEARPRHRDTLLAVQCSDNCIRLFAICSIVTPPPTNKHPDDAPPERLTQRAVSSSSTSSTKSVYSQADVTTDATDNEKTLLTNVTGSFLRPIRILEGHTTGEWSIKLNIICGKKYSVYLPQSWYQDGMSGTKKATGGKNTKGGILTNDGKSHPPHSSKTSYRNIIPIDSGGGGESSAGGAMVGAVGVGSGGGGQGSTGAVVVGVDLSSLLERSHLEGSRSMDASPRGRRSRSQSRGSSVSDDRDLDFTDTGSGSGVGDDGDLMEEDEDSLVGDEDDNDLSMIAGLVSSQLMANEDSMQQEDEDEVSMRLGGTAGLAGEGARLKSVFEQQQQQRLGGPSLHASEWQGSLMISTGSSNGKVFIYDISTLSGAESPSRTSHSGDKIGVKSSHTSSSSSYQLSGGNGSAPGAQHAPFSSLVWKVLHAQSSGKSYGVTTSKDNSTLITYGSESSVKVWSLFNTSH